MITIEKIYKEIFPDKVYIKEYESQILEEIYEYVNKSVDNKVNVVYNDIHKALVTADDLITHGESSIAQLYIETAIHNYRNIYGGSPYSVIELSSEDIPVMVDK